MKIENKSFSDVKVDEFRADELSPEVFRSEYWMTNSPVLIKGALKHWPAFSKWRQTQYLINNLRDTDVKIRTVPLNQTIHETKPLKTYRLHEFLKKIAEPDEVPIWLGSVSFSEKRTILTRYKDLDDHCFSDQLSELSKKDFGSLPFLNKPKAAKIYPNWRLFIYKNMYTDWHAHPADTHMFGQLCGSKEVLLFPANEGHALFKYVREEQTHTYNTSKDLRSRIEDSRPIRVVVEEGDMLHIPVFWYHAVQPISKNSYGISIIRACANPFRVSGDSRFIMNQDIFDDTPRLLKPLVILSRISAFLQRNRPLNVDMRNNS